MNVQQDSIHVMQKLNAQIVLAHTHVHAMVDTLGTDCSARTKMSVEQDNIHVIDMQNVQINLAHTHVHAIVDSVEMDRCART